MDEERYFVGGPGGQRFGPVTVEELKLWRQEKRLQLSSILIRESDEQTFTASEILGILRPPIPAQAPSQQAGQPGRNANSGVIIGAVIIGVFCLCCGPIGAILFPAFASAKVAAQKAQEMENLSRVAIALTIYASDNDDTLPPDLSSGGKVTEPLYQLCRGARCREVRRKYV